MTQTISELTHLIRWVNPFLARSWTLVVSGIENVQYGASSESLYLTKDTTR